MTAFLPQIAGGVLILGILGAILYYIRKAGKDAERADRAEGDLGKVIDTNRPPDPDDIDRVRERYRRD